jgi:choline kinase
MHNRTVIIPAAGRGNRLRPISDRKPKALVEVDGYPLIMRTTRALAELGHTSQLVVVVGYRGDEIEQAVRAENLPFPVAFVRNDRFAETNSIVSVWLTQEYWQEGFVLIDSDIWFSPALLDPLFTLTQSTLIIDARIPPEKIDMKVSIQQSRIWDLDKQRVEGPVAGEFFGMSYFSASFGQALGEEMRRQIEAGHEDVWYEYALREVARTRALQPWYLEAEHEWTEVDTPADLELADRIVSRHRKRSESAKSGN